MSVITNLIAVVSGFNRMHKYQVDFSVSNMP